MKDKLKHLLMLGLLVVALATATAQEEQSPQMLVESLLVKLPKLREDTGKVNLRNLDPESGVKYAQQGLALAMKLNWEKGAAKLNQSLANSYMAQADYTHALEGFFKALKISEEIGNKQYIASSLCNIGAVYDYQNEFNKAIEYYSKALDMVGLFQILEII